MSVDLRDRLRAATPGPAHPLDVEAVVRRGRRMRRVRVGAVVGATMVVAVGATSVITGLLPQRELPVIANTFSPQDALADGRVSWREYRIAVDATADCLAEAGASDAYSFDSSTGRFHFTDTTSNALARCRSRYLEPVEDQWDQQTGPAADRISWTDYQTVTRQLADCLDEQDIEAIIEFDLRDGQQGFTYRVPESNDQSRQTTEQAVNHCQQQSGFADAQDAWNQQNVSGPAEEAQLTALTVTCMQREGLDVPDTDALGPAAQQHPETHERCLAAARRAYRPYLGAEVATTNLTDRIEAARRRWDDAQITSYTYESEGTCGWCGPGLNGHMRTTVTDNEISRVVQLDDDNSETVPVTAGATITDMFDSLARDARAGNVASATFHPELGYPTSIHIVRDPADPSRTLRATIVHLEPAEAH